LNKFLHKIVENRFAILENLKDKYDSKVVSEDESEGSDGSVD